MGDHGLMMQCGTVETTCIIPFCKAIKRDVMPYIQRLSVFRLYTHIRDTYLQSKCEIIQYILYYNYFLPFFVFLWHSTQQQDPACSSNNKGCLTLEISEIIPLLANHLEEHKKGNPHNALIFYSESTLGSWRKCYSLDFFITYYQH